MPEQERPEHPEQAEQPPCGRTPIVFPAGDLDAMIFHEDYTVPHSQR